MLPPNPIHEGDVTALRGSFYQRPLTCYMQTTSLSVSSGDPNTRKRYETRARSASVLLFSSVWSPDETRETSCLHNISNENISLAVQFIKRN